MKTQVLLTIVIALAGLAALPAAGQDDELAALKQRFKQRYPTLVQLKESKKVGEVHTGLADAVKSSYLGDEATNGTTIKQFLAAENKDRRRLYELLAEKTDTTADEVATARAAQLFEQGKADWYFKPAGSDWKQKKDIK